MDKRSFEALLGIDENTISDISYIESIRGNVSFRDMWEFWAKNHKLRRVLTLWDACDEYLQGVPECYYKPTVQTKPHCKLAIFNSFAWWTPAHCIANRAAAIVALAKQIKSAGAGVSAAIAFRQIHKSGASAQTLFPVNLDALNLGKFAFMMSPTFFRTYIFMMMESQFNYWQRAKSAASEVISPSGTPDHLRQINFPDGYQDFIHGGRTKAQVRKLNIEHMKDLYGTPERAFETIKKQFAENVERIKHLQK
ncbi:hypothetical protein P3B99_004990 [Opitutia bacterium KCR 482]